MANERWAYRVIDLKPTFLGLKTDAIQEALNQLGLQGWELVSTQAQGLGLRLFLKRAL